MNATILMISKVILAVAILGPVLDWLFRDYPGWGLLIVLMAVAVRYFFWVHGKFQTVGDRFKKIDERFVEIDKQFIHVNHRIDTVEAKVDVLKDRVDGLERKMDKRFDRIEKQLNRITQFQSKKLRRKFRTSS